MIISPSMSLLVAGVASGICYVLLGNLRSRKDSKVKGRKQTAVDDGRCACCLAPFLIGRGVRCSDCGVRSCRKTCSRWDTSDNAWHCLFCHQQRWWVKRGEKWFENFGCAANEEEEEELHRSFGTAKSRVYLAGYAAAVTNMEQIQEDREEIRTMHAIRNFVEKIVEDLIDNVDNMPIDRLYTDSEYDKFLEEHRPSLIAALTRLVTCLQASLTNKPSTDPPAMAHAALKEIVERAVEEARKLPKLSASADTEHSPEGCAIADHSYEDVLATAILNKVIERFQRERVDGNSNVLRDTDPTKVKYTSIESEHEEDAGRYMSYRLECNGDRDASIRRNEDHREPISFTMEERIEEVTTITSDDELRDSNVLKLGSSRRVPFPEFGMDIVDPPCELSLPLPTSSSDSSDSARNRDSPVRTKYDRAMDVISPIESWEDNWLFQKKKAIRSQPDAVAMLVPSSNTYYKALIGDRDAEDTSDLSECSSTRSDEEIEKELMEAINNVVPRTPRISECDTANNQELPGDVTSQLGKDEIDACQTRLENNVAVCEHFDKQNDEKLLQVSKVNVVKDIGDKEGRNESGPALITETEMEENKTKEYQSKSTAGERRDERTISTAMESSSQKDMKVQSEKSSERNDRGNVADEEEEQRESEYTEHYDTAIQRHLDSLTKVDVCPGENRMADGARKLTEEEFTRLENNPTIEQNSECSEAEKKIQSSYTATEKPIDVTAENDRLSSPPRPGTIAEREHKKWENAPPIENNPYSEESIRKRSWEKRYSRKPADISGAHYEITKLNEVNAGELLAPDLPDIKRFGRDYYINQSKEASGERPEQTRSVMPLSSRPSSSLSQRSSCAEDEQRERQEETTSKQNDGILILREDRDTRRTALWRRNNVEVINSSETNNRVAYSLVSVDADRQRTRNERDMEDDGTRKEQRADDILEDQRKNSKNVINAKLNNQEHNLEAEHQDERNRQVRRINLKAYGFENEFSDQRAARKQQRVVNRLDLSSFGYQDGLRRALSNNQLDQRNNEKSNLTRDAIDREKRQEYEGPIDMPKPLGCKELKSSRDLNKLQDEIKKVGSLISVKSMPNIADDAYYYANPICVKDDNEDELAIKNLLDCVSDKTQDVTTDERGIMNTDEEEASSDTDKSFEDTYIGSEDQFRGMHERLPMPSVKRLAEAFGRRQTSVIESTPVKVNRTLMAKVDDIKDRSSTPEVQIVETPRQMHSLTARSLSREFREGLRQMPSKVTSSPVGRSLMERPTNQKEIVRSKREDNDIAVISPGKLKSNIIFWEQMQKKS